MKITETSNAERRTPNIERPGVAPANSFGIRSSKFEVRCSPSSQRGVALVITVILLAVVTFMALTFLAISRRERGAVTTTTDAATARLAADDALASAEAQIMANTLAATDPYNFGLLVSTNYINSYGFVPGVVSPTNVSYYYAANGQPVNASDFPQLLANLYYNPRVPVYMSNTVTRAMENRFYLDLNRDGQDEPNGLVPEIAANGQYIHQDGSIGPINANVLTNFQVGDPEWIGVLQHPDQPYGPNNPFVARYAFVAVPIGNALDLNANYNDANGIDTTMRAGSDGFLRNQGVGSWEINLAAFLTDLNTNQWDPITDPYNYREPNNNMNQGRGFEDAFSLLRYRYGGNSILNPLNNLASANNLFAFDFTANAFKAGEVFPYDRIDAYVAGPVMTGFQLPVDNDNTAAPWAGADNTNHFFDMQELFNSSGNFPAFANSLLAAGGSPFFPNSTYNRYTYYRLLSQMGVDSAPEQDQINLNYSNAFAYFDNNGVVTNITVFPGAETNLVPWQPLQFFTIAADRMLRAYTTEWRNSNPTNFAATFFAVNDFNFNNANQWTNYPPFGLNGAVGVMPGIPVLVSNQFVYTPAVQRVLQLAANMYDATTNNTAALGTNFPSVFRPIFLVTNNPVSGYRDVYVSGYEQVVSVPLGLNDPQLNLPVDISALASGSFGFGTFTNLNVYGVPWIVGAKKGFPNFNEFAMESVFQLTRKLEVTRPNTNSPVSAYSYNQMFNLSVSNQVGVEYWNSYTNDFMRPVAILVTNIMTGVLSNDEGFSTNLNYATGGRLFISQADYNNNGWPGYNPPGSGASVPQILLAPASFQIPLETNIAPVTNSTYRFNVGGTPYLDTTLNLPYEENVSGFPQPHWFSATTNYIQAFILDDTPPYHVIDYVQLSGPNSTRDLTAEIVSNYDIPVVDPDSGLNQLWNTNYQAGRPNGLLSQITLSLGKYGMNASPSPPNIVWYPGTDQGTENGIDAFLVFFHQSPLWNNPSGQSLFAVAAATNAWAAPYQPTATVVQHVDWQVNDPLVHYMANDLNWPGALRYDVTPENLTSTTNNTSNLGQLNTWYMPWGGYPAVTTTLNFNSANAYNLSIKNPLVWRSDDWDFSSYKFPSVGWLGRVHRGTPWQTVYLKSPDILREIQIVGGNQTNFVGPSQWAEWTGDSLLTPPTINGEYYDAYNTAPVQDRLLFDLFTTAPNDNASRGTLSVNVGASEPNDPQAGLAAWSAVLSGVQVVSNNASDFVLSQVAQHNGSLANFTTFPINPAGPGGTNSAVGQIVAGINQARANAFNTARIIPVKGVSNPPIINEIPAASANIDGLPGAFEHVGDILSVPQLTDESPLLNWNDPNQATNGISEEMYDWLPQQIMSLLRVSGKPQSPMRYVIYSYGQALKPAPNGIYTGGGTLFGMVTNYQVVAESATRTLVNFGSVETNIVSLVVTNNDFGVPITNWVSLPVVTNNNAQIQQFNVLPPN